MKILILPGSLRKDSLNLRLARVIERELASSGNEPTVADPALLDMPLYNGDLEKESGLPANARKLAELFRDHEAVVFCAPEYNYSVSGVVKNAVDWLSRERPTDCLGQRPIFLTAASPAGPGGIRGLWQLRIPLEGRSAYVHSPMFALSKAGGAFDGDGNLKDEQTRDTLRSMLDGFLSFASALAE